MKKKDILNTKEYFKYKELIGTVETDVENKRLYGHVVGTSDKISYEGHTIEELERDFHEAVDDYISFCKEKGRKPEKSFSGTILFRATPEVHSVVAQVARKGGKSINSWLLDLVSEAIKKDSWIS